MSTFPPFLTQEISLILQSFQGTSKQTNKKKKKRKKKIKKIKKISALVRPQPLPDQELSLHPVHKSSLLEQSFRLYLVHGTSITLPLVMLRHPLLPDAWIQLTLLELGCCAAVPWTQPFIMEHMGLSPRPICFSTPYVKPVG